MSKSTFLKTTIFILILVFYGSLSVYKIALPATDDLPRQMKIGQMILQGDFSVLYHNILSYVEPEYPFVNSHWLSGTIFYLVHLLSGWGGLVAFKVIVLISAFLLLFKTALKKADFWLVAGLSLPTIIILSYRSSLRPEIFSYLFIAIFMYLLIDLEEHPERKRIFWLIPLQLLWVNMHLFFSIGIMLVTGFLFEKIILNLPKSFFEKFNWQDIKNLKDNIIVKKLGLLLMAVVVVSLINPRGIEGLLYHYPSNFSVGVSEIRSLSQVEKNMAPMDSTPILFFKPMAFVLAISFIFSFKSKHKPIFYFLASIATIAMTFYIIRSMALFGMIFLPSASTNLNEVFVRIKNHLSSGNLQIRDVLYKILILIFTATLVYGILPSTRNKISPSTYLGLGLTDRSADSAKFFKENNLRGPIFNNAGAGSYILYYLYPPEKVFVDNRFGISYSADLFRNVYFPILDGDGAWQESLKKYDFNILFFYQYEGENRTRSFLWKRMRDPQWTLIYADTYNLIFVKNIPENKNIIDKFQINEQNIGQKLEYLTKSGNFDDQVAAADIFALMGRVDLSQRTFLNVVYEWPEKSKIWMIMGEWEMLNDNPDSRLLTMMYLERAVAEGQKTAEAYSFLGAAYNRLGQREKAIEALKKALKINPDREDAKDLLTQVERDFVIEKNN